MKNNRTAFMEYGGGAAFPVDMGMKIWPGMSLRDFFAGMALASCLLNESEHDLIAQHCYKQADAMLAEREKKESK